MDFYLTSLPTVRETLGNEISSTHRMLLQELDLTVMLFLDEEDKTRINPSDVRERNERDNSGQARKQIGSVLAAINSVGRKLLDYLDPSERATRMVRRFRVESSNSFLTCNRQDDVGLTLTLLKYGRHLRKTMSHDVFDFSSVQAITRCITDSVENCPPPFISLATQARALSETVSLSSGLGLNEIWSALYVDELPTTVVTRLGDLEKFASSLRRSADASRRPNISFLTCLTDLFIVRRQLFDFMALRTLPASMPEVADSILLELESELEHVRCRK
jgi:midasin